MSGKNNHVNKTKLQPFMVLVKREISGYVNVLHPSVKFQHTAVEWGPLVLQQFLIFLLAVALRRVSAHEQDTSVYVYHMLL